METLIDEASCHLARCEKLLSLGHFPGDWGVWPYVSEVAAIMSFPLPLPVGRVPGVSCGVRNPMKTRNVRDVGSVC